MKPDQALIILNQIIKRDKSPYITRLIPGRPLLIWRTRTFSPIIPLEDSHPGEKEFRIFTRYDCCRGSAHAMGKMSNEDIYKELVSKLHGEHAFWSYENDNISHVSDESLIANVLLHLDIDDSLLLFKLYPRRKIQQVWKDKMLAQEPMYHGLNRLYAFLFFNIKHPDRYIRDFKNKRYKSLICKG